MQNIVHVGGDEMQSLPPAQMTNDDLADEHVVLREEIRNICDSLRDHNEGLFTRTNEWKNRAVFAKQRIGRKLDAINDEMVKRGLVASKSEAHKQISLDLMAKKIAFREKNQIFAAQQQQMALLKQQMKIEAQQAEDRRFVNAARAILTVDQFQQILAAAELLRKSVGVSA